MDLLFKPLYKKKYIQTARLQHVSNQCNYDLIEKLRVAIKKNKWEMLFNAQ